MLPGAPGWLKLVKSQLLTNFTSGHDLRFVSSSPTTGSALTAQSLKPASASMSPSLSPPPLLAFSLPLSCLLSLCRLKINIKKFFKKVLPAFLS